MPGEDLEIGRLIATIEGDDGYSITIENAIKQTEAFDNQVRDTGRTVDEFNKKSSNGYGNRFLARHLANEAGRAIGIGGLGDGASLFFQTMRAAGPAVAGVAVAATAVAVEMNIIRNANFANKQLQVDINNELAKTARLYGDMGNTPILQAAGLGAYNQQLVQSREGVYALIAAENKRRAEFKQSYSARIQDNFEDILFGHSSQEVQGDIQNRQIRAAIAQMNIAKQQANAEHDIALQRLGADRAEIITRAANNDLLDGTGRRRIQLEEGIIEARRRVYEKNDDLIRAVKNANEQELTAAKEENLNGGNVDIAALQIEQNRRLLEVQREAGKNEQADLVDSASKRTALREQEYQETLSIQNQLSTAIIGIQKFGGDRELAQIEESGRQKIEVYARQMEQLLALENSDAKNVAIAQLDKLILKTKELTDAQAATASSQFTHTQLESIKNFRGMSMELEDYGKQLQAAVKLGEANGGLSQKDANDLFRRKAFEIGLTAPHDTGTFGQGRSAGGTRGDYLNLRTLDMTKTVGSVDFSKGGDGTIVGILQDIHTLAKRFIPLN